LGYRIKIEVENSAQECEEQNAGGRGDHSLNKASTRVSDAARTSVLHHKNHATVIHADNLTRKFGALDGRGSLNLEVNAGEIFALVGRTPGRARRRRCG